jgi:ERCC4-type nuclease
LSLRVDMQAGSSEFLAPMLAAGLPAEPDRLPAGDVEMLGRGPGGRPLLVGVEIKLVRDMLTCVRDGRFAEQARKMKARYEVGWLLIEGEWRIGGTGLIEVRERGGWRERGRFTHQEIAAWAMTMVQRGRVLTWRTRDRDESVDWLRTLYWWWTSKDFEVHRAHLDWYTPPYVAENPMDMSEPGVVQKVAAALLAQGATVDVNSERAKAAAAHFTSVRAMVGADEKTWREVDGVGAKIARRVVEAVQ